MTVPPHWAELVRSSAEVQLHTEWQMTTWQSLPELDKEDGDFSYEQATTVSSSQGSEGGNLHLSQPLHNVQNNRVSFLDAPVQNEQEIISTSATNTNSQNLWQMPSAINLDSSGLRCSSQAEVLKGRDKVYSHTTEVGQGSSLHSASKRCFKSALVLFSSICSVGYGLPSIAHSLQEKVTVTSSNPQSAFSKAIDSYHQVNSLYDGTINCFSTMAQASTASNKTFTYKQAMREKDYHEFIKAMIKEVDDHKNRNYWTIMSRQEMPADAKTIMAIWSFKCKRFPDGTLDKHKAHLCAHGGMQTWGQNY